MRTVSRCSPNTRAASRVLIPSTMQARRTRAYISTLYILHTFHRVAHNSMEGGGRYGITAPHLYAITRLHGPLLLRRLHRGAAEEEEDEIYQAFLTNTPSSQRDEFRFWHHCLHGRPIPGYTPAPKPAPSTEIRDALVALYNATNGPGWNNNENWLSEAPLDQWSGVFTACDGSLTDLVLRNNELTGSIPSELGSLSNLTALSLEYNQLTGPIPTELGNLSKLQFLNLGDNQLTRPIPSELGNLSKCNCSDLMRSEELSACDEGVGMLGMPGAEQGGQGHLGVSPTC